MNELTESSPELLGPSPDERRTYQRFASRYPAKFKDTRSDFGKDVYLRDASAGGVKITSKERLYLNDNVTLEVELPDGKDAMVLRGEVAWVKNRDADIWSVGIKFHKIVFMDMWRSFRFTEPDSTS